MLSLSNPAVGTLDILAVTVPVVGTSKGLRSTEADWKAAVAPGTADGDAIAEGVVEHDNKAGNAITVGRCAE